MVSGLLRTNHEIRYLMSTPPGPRRALMRRVGADQSQVSVIMRDDAGCFPDAIRSPPPKLHTPKTGGGSTRTPRTVDHEEDTPRVPPHQAKQQYVYIV